MKKYLLIILSLCWVTSFYGQTIIDLKPGGKVRSKTMEEYRQEEPGWAEKQKADSLQYNDNLTRALNALYRDSLNQAEELLKASLKLRPQAAGNYILRHYLGRIAMARGNYREAISQFSVLLKDYPNFRDARFDRASCYLEIKNVHAALEDCETLFNAELKKEEKIKALFLRSACHTENRHPEKAKDDLEMILKEDPANESAQLLLAFAYLHLGQNAEALNRLNLFVASHPQSVEGLVARAELEEQQQMLEVARADYDKAIALAPQDATLYAKRAKLLLQMNLRLQAEKDIHKAIDLGYPSQSLYPLLK